MKFKYVFIIQKLVSRYLKYAMSVYCDHNWKWWLICAMSYYRVFGAKRRKGDTRKPTKWWIFRVFAWRPFAPPHESTTLFMRRLFVSCLSYLCLAGRKVAMRKHEIVIIWRAFAWRPRPARQRYDKQGRKRERSPRENPPNDDYFMFSPRHTKVRNIPCLAFSATVCRIFAWRGERSPCEIRQNHLLAGFRVATFRVFAPKTRLYDMA